MTTRALTRVMEKRGNIGQQVTIRNANDAANVASRRRRVVFRPMNCSLRIRSGNGTPLAASTRVPQRLRVASSHASARPYSRQWRVIVRHASSSVENSLASRIRLDNHRATG